MSYEWILIPAVGTALWATFFARAATLRGCKVAPLALLALLISFVETTTALLIWAGAAGLPSIGVQALAVAAVGGVGGGVGLCFSYAALRQRATGPVTTIASMSVLVPIALGLVLGWDAAPGLMTVLGALLTLGGTIAINLGKAPRLESERYHWIGLALGAMLCFGVSQAAQKGIVIVDPRAGQDAASSLMLMSAYYLAAFLTLLIYVTATRQGIERRAWAFALALATGSFAQFACMMIALKHVSTVKVYITFSGGGVILILLVSAWLLRERYRMAVWVGCLAGIAGVVLMRVDRAQSAANAAETRPASRAAMVHNGPRVLPAATQIGR